MEHLKIMPKYEPKGISLIYVNPVLTFEQIILTINEYVKEKYNFNSKEKIDKALSLNVGQAVSHLKNYFDNFYRKGIALNSFVHGKIEVELLAYALRPYEIKFIPIDTIEYVLAFVTLDELGKVSVNSNYNIDLLIEEFKKYLDRHEVVEGVIVKKRRF